MHNNKFKPSMTKSKAHPSTPMAALANNNRLLVYWMVALVALVQPVAAMALAVVLLVAVMALEVVLALVTLVVVASLVLPVQALVLAKTVPVQVALNHPPTCHHPK
ncbi:uncharacterized protein LOC118733772 [Rhagoletis pomonella]|uniref:uncharacterized protein LOC118733772 n=1 Tax=Rhagoletis pomonella TaxID=28610 RepID=UPI001785C923|nr:uncharacterized protein LOC118733772 [Rhagoletis pomonella]